MSVCQSRPASGLLFVVLLEVREDVDLRIFLRWIAAAGSGTLNLAELLRETLQRAQVQMLIGKPQHAVPAEREQHLPEIALTQWLRQIDPARRCAKHRTGGFNGEHHTSPAVSRQS